MIQIPRETAEAALAALHELRRKLIINNLCNGRQGADNGIGAINAHMEILRVALIPPPAPPQHIFAGWCPDASQPDSLDPDCPACRTLLTRRGAA